MPKGERDERRGAATRCEVCDVCARDQRAPSYCIYGGPYAGYQQRDDDPAVAKPEENESS